MEKIIEAIKGFLFLSALFLMLWLSLILAS
jgi:hypothetical protein